MQYRSLTSEELKALEKEFVEFLILNGITADSWERLKQDDIVAAELVIDQFSDVVFESIFRKNQFLERRDATSVQCIQFLENKFIHVGLLADSNERIDFNDPAFIASAQINPPSGLKVFLNEVSYTEKREIEMFRYTEQGYYISEDRLFKTLCLMYAEKKA